MQNGFQFLFSRVIIFQIEVFLLGKDILANDKAFQFLFNGFLADKCTFY